MDIRPQHLFPITLCCFLIKMRVEDLGCQAPSYRLRWSTGDLHLWGPGIPSKTLKHGPGNWTPSGWWLNFKQTHLKHIMRTSHWVKIFPKFRGEDNKIFETTAQSSKNFFVSTIFADTEKDIDVESTNR